MSKNSIIDRYSTIYYVDIVVANKYSTLEELSKHYVFSDDTPLDDSIMYNQCSVCTIKCIDDNKDCILVKYNHDVDIKGLNKTIDLINTVCHEAGHCVLDIYSHMGQLVTQDAQEPFCYLLGYIGECIYTTLTK